MALVLKMTCDLRHPMHPRHLVQPVSKQMRLGMPYNYRSFPAKEPYNKMALLLKMTCDLKMRLGIIISDSKWNPE